MKRLILCTTFLVFAYPALAADNVNLTGSWSIHSSIAGNDNDLSCKFVQTDATLSGTCTSDNGDVQISGSVDGKKVTWKYSSEYQGTALTIVYSATVEDIAKITGSVDVQPFGVTGDFTAKPVKDAAK